MTWLKLAILSVVGWQGTLTLQKNAERTRKFQEAESYARSVGKPLLVISGPYGNTLYRWFNIKAHGCGDVCLDIHAEACTGCPLTIVGDIRSIPYPDKYFGAAFAAHVVEHMPTVQEGAQAINEMARVADRIWIVVPGKLQFQGVFHADHHIWVTEAPGGYVLEQR